MTRRRCDLERGGQARAHPARPPGDGGGTGAGPASRMRVRPFAPVASRAEARSPAVPSVVMEVASLGLQTDLALLERSGSTIEDCGDHLVVRTPDNPLHWWGNFLLLPRPPPPPPSRPGTGSTGSLPRSRTPPHRRHRRGRHRRPGGGPPRHAPTPGCTSRPADGDDRDRSVHEPPHLQPGRRPPARLLSPTTTGPSWSTSRLACKDDLEPVAYREFCERKADSNRRLVEAGHGLPGPARSRTGGSRTSMGLLRAGEDLGAVPVGRDPPGRARPGDWPGRWCTTSAATAWTSSRPSTPW